MAVRTERQALYGPSLAFRLVLNHRRRQQSANEILSHHIPPSCRLFTTSQAIKRTSADDENACFPFHALQSRPLVSVGLLSNSYLYLVCITRQSIPPSPTASLPNDLLSLIRQLSSSSPSMVPPMTAWLLQNALATRVVQREA
jgi:hypothetical protein